MVPGAAPQATKCSRTASALALALVLLVGVVGFKSARNGGRVEPERSFVNCMDASDLRIAAPGRPGPPRLRNALAAQARNPKRPRGAPPPSLDESALGRSGRCGALYTACIGFKFALQTPISTRCAPAATPSPFPGDVCGSTRKRRPDASFATNATHATQAVKPAFVAHVEWLHGNGVAILHRLPASVALRPSQNRRSRNRPLEIWILNALL